MLVLTPSLIAAASLASRRWGPAVGGLPVGLPLTSGPVALFLALEHGTAFAAEAAVGTLSGLFAVAIFCLVYGRLASRLGWPASLAAALVVFCLVTGLLGALSFTPAIAFLVVVATFALVLRLLPRIERRQPDPAAAQLELPRWEIPARMVLATTFVVLLTSAATALGPRLSGLLAPIPIVVGILAVFTRHFGSAEAAIGLLRGVVRGSFSFAAFFFVLTLLIEPAGLLIGFGGAILVALLIQGLAEWAARVSIG